MGTGQLNFERLPTYARYPPLISPETVAIWPHLTPKKVRFGVAAVDLGVVRFFEDVCVQLYSRNSEANCLRLTEQPDAWAEIRMELLLV
ncbi:unnamed protein product [Protopolystoma xenopodis]|uniref:Uncharacterized protein n=1 Tax=Protopolystoma xenopodis TaxID=117903 RepID=A0A3S5C231_9PLAT|nr:unnamed protein product [Protopolystoma xenopodis]